MSLTDRAGSDPITRGSSRACDAWDAGPLRSHRDRRQRQASATQVVRRQLTYQPGEIFRLSQIEDEPAEALRAGDVLSSRTSARSRRRGSSRPSSRRASRCARASHARSTSAFGYGSEEKVAGGRSTGGTSTSSAARGRCSCMGGTRRSIAASGLNFRQPAFPLPRYGLTASAQAWHDSEPAYTLEHRRRGDHDRTAAREGRARSQRSAATTLTLHVHRISTSGISISNEALQDLSFRDELIALPSFRPSGVDPRSRATPARALLSSLAFDVRRSTVENQINARTGYVGDRASRAGRQVAAGGLQLLRDDAGRALLPGPWAPRRRGRPRARRGDRSVVGRGTRACRSSNGTSSEARTTCGDGDASR